MVLLLFYNGLKRHDIKSGGSNSKTQWAKIKKWVLVEGRTGSMFIAELIEMNLLHILNLELTKLK